MSHHLQLSSLMTETDRQTDREAERDSTDTNTMRENRSVMKNVSVLCLRLSSQLSVKRGQLIPTAAKQAQAHEGNSLKLA